jgi:hypothetical protein
MTEDFHGFSQSLQVIIWRVHRFLPNPFEFIIHQSSYHSTLYNLAYWQRRKRNHKHIFFLGQNIFLGTLLWNSFKVRKHVSHPYKTTDQTCCGRQRFWGRQWAYIRISILFVVFLSDNTAPRMKAVGIYETSAVQPTSAYGCHHEEDPNIFLINIYLSRLRMFLGGGGF